MKIGETRYIKIDESKVERIKCVSINGVKTKIMLSKGMKPRDLPNRMVTKKEKTSGCERMKEEFDLSKKRREPGFYPEVDVKEFIRRLKEELRNKTSLDDERVEGILDIKEAVIIINRLSGEKLNEV